MVGKHIPFFFVRFRTEVVDILERDFQKRLIRKIKKDLPGCIVLKNDPNYLQGFPDLLILYGPRWAAVEVKRSPDAKHQPNQDYYVDRLNRMSYAAFINPENERKIRNDIYQALGAGRNTRLPEPE